MNAEDLVEFLTWIESIATVRLEFSDKETLARGFLEQRSYRRLCNNWVRSHGT